MHRMSIIVPMYNVEEFVGVCIRSIVESARKADHAAEIEVVLVDDASTDRSLELAECELRSSAVSFKTLRHITNQGVGQARRTGCGAADGEFLWYVDPDDEITETAVQTVFSSLDAIPEHGFAEYPRILWETERGVRRPPDYFVGSAPGGRIHADGAPISTAEYAEQLLLRRVPGVVWTKIFRRSILTPDIVDTSRQSEDLVTLFQVLDRQPTVLFRYDAIYVYRQRNGSLTTGRQYQRGSHDAYEKCLAIARNSAWFEIESVPASKFFEISRIAVPRLQALASVGSLRQFLSYFRSVTRSLDHEDRLTLREPGYLGEGRTSRQARLIIWSRKAWMLSAIPLYVYGRFRS